RDQSSPTNREVSRRSRQAPACTSRRGVRPYCTRYLAAHERLVGKVPSQRCARCSCSGHCRVSRPTPGQRFMPCDRVRTRQCSGVVRSGWAELHGLRLREDGRPASKLAYYSGRGSLAGWLRAVVSQLAVDQHRKQARLVQTEDDAEFDRIAADGSEEKEAVGRPSSLPNPENALTNKLAGSEMEGALASAIQEMDDEDRLLVKLYYFDNLRLKEAGAVLGVHEATASRRLARVHTELRQRVEQILTKEHGWSIAETRTAFAEVALHLDTDLEPLLATKAITSENLSPD